MARRSGPPFHHRPVPPAADAPGAHPHPRTGTLIRFVLTRQRRRPGGRAKRLTVKISSRPSKRLAARPDAHLKPPGLLAQTGNPLLRRQPPGRLHRRLHRVLQLLGQVVHHVLHLVVAAPLHRIVVPVHPVNRRTKRPRAVDDEKPTPPGPHAALHQLLKKRRHDRGVLGGARPQAQNVLLAPCVHPNGHDDVMRAEAQRPEEVDVVKTPLQRLDALPAHGRLRHPHRLGQLGKNGSSGSRPPASAPASAPPARGRLHGRIRRLPTLRAKPGPPGCRAGGPRHPACLDAARPSSTASRPARPMTSIRSSTASWDCSTSDTRGKNACPCSATKAANLWVSFFSIW